MSDAVGPAGPAGGGAGGAGGAGNAGPPSPAARLRRVLENESSSVRLQGALAAGTTPDASFVDVLVRRSAVEPDFFVREMLTWALMRHPSSATVRRLVYEVGADESQARSQALHTLSKIGDPAGWAAITPELLRDPDDGVARAAWRTAAGVVPAGQEPELAEHLCSQLARGTHETERSLSRALAMLGAAALAPLEARRGDASGRVRVHAAATERLVADPDADLDELFGDAQRAEDARRAGQGPLPDATETATANGPA
ncbi:MULTISPECIES: HEAT repeat domain-containing protein [Subtercola]|uniref:HEAT repeat domain-containing protein n=1 Tax=Subtercola TaxID=120212 RepID=UPI00191E3271|nr:MULTISPECIES: HEAT repeat domain-containing protein [Subtercola]MEA9985216.1 HEAT repeat domain-containing protein [Subtercola sp. RTI3]